MIGCGERIKELRKNKKMTQEQLARRLSVAKSCVSAYEVGERLPSYENLIGIAKLFHVTTDYLLGADKIMPCDISGLTQSEVMAIKNMIEAMREIREERQENTERET